MKKTLIITMSLLLVLGLVFASSCGVFHPKPTVSSFPGWAPGSGGLAISPDGKVAYIPFAAEDLVAVVDLSTFTTIKSIDISSAGSMLTSNSAALSPDGSKLYVANSGTQNVMIINTEESSVEKILPISTFAEEDKFSVSHDGAAVYITSDDGKLYIVNGYDNSYRQISKPGIFFESVEPSATNPKLLYCIGQLSGHKRPPHQAFFTFNLSSNAVERDAPLPDTALPLDVIPSCLTISPDETIAYFGPHQFTGEKGFGNFSGFDLDSFQMLFSTPIECGVFHFAINGEKDKIYIIGFWSGGDAPGTLYITEWDMSTNRIVREIPVSPSTDCRAIAIDPTDSDYLYMTEADFNLLRKVKISTGKEIKCLKFNKEDISPYAIIKGDNIGYVVGCGSHHIYKLDLTSGQLIGTIPMPRGAPVAGGYHQGKLYFLGGKHIYCVDPSDGSLIGKFNIGKEVINPSYQLTFFNDKMAAIIMEPGGMIGKEIMIFDAKTMTLLKTISLPTQPPMPHGDRVIASPDGSRLYISRGLTFGETVITVYDASTFNVISTIEIPYEYQHTGNTGWSSCDFDETNRILYMCGYESIYKIDMDTNKFIENLPLVDLFDARRAAGKGCWGPPSGLCGVALSSTKDKLFVVAGDQHCMYTYDLVNSCWMTKVTNLKGYFTLDTCCSLDRRYLYTLNQRSDSVTMVDLTSGDVIKVITLVE